MSNPIQTDTAIWQRAFQNLRKTADFVGVAPCVTIDASLQTLNQHSWKDEEGTTLHQLQHHLHGAFEVPAHTDGQKNMLLVFASKGENQDCHACAPWWLSFMEFQPKGNDWVFARRSLATTKIGAWGEVAEMHVVPLTPTQYAVFFDFSFTARWTGRYQGLQHQYQ